MKSRNYFINLTEQERSEIIYSLIAKKNALIAQGRYTDLIDDVICKLWKTRQFCYKKIIAKQGAICQKKSLKIGG